MWEYVCSAGSNNTNCFGDEINLTEDYAWFHDNGAHSIHAVAKKKPNAFGLYDMHGNVWEWVADSYHKNYVGAPSDGSAWEDKRLPERIKRGGGYFDRSSLLTASFRMSGDDFLCSTTGFRLAILIEE